MGRAKPLPPPRLVRHEVAVAGLDPRHDGVVIAHLSDIHVGNLTPASHVRAAIELANDAAPDVVALTGDYVCWRKHEVGLVRDQLGGLRATRVAATLGNHDYFTDARGVRAALAGHGYDVLDNQHTRFDVRGAPLTLVGIDDPITHHDDADGAFAGVGARADGTTVALCHDPELAPELVARGARLVLSGHMHGGQIYLRGVTDRIIARMGRTFRRGFYPIDDGHLYVTPGVGFSGVRVRVGEGTASEVAVFTLRAA
ncbi:MAG: metallophosphoesterase [Myxococcales bacterium]|nr:metallophosphoesterase [Myxococcales bacterium]